MVPSTSASKRRLKAATSRFWAVTSTAQAQQSRGSRGSGPLGTGRCAPGTSAMARLAPARLGHGPYSPLSCPSPCPASPHAPYPGMRLLEYAPPHTEERTRALDIPQAPPGRGSPWPGSAHSLPINHGLTALLPVLSLLSPEHYQNRIFLILFFNINILTQKSPKIGVRLGRPLCPWGRETVQCEGDGTVNPPPLRSPSMEGKNRQNEKKAPEKLIPGCPCPR